jgi:hypothetical protein
MHSDGSKVVWGGMGWISGVRALTAARENMANIIPFHTSENFISTPPQQPYDLIYNTHSFSYVT